MLAQHAPGSLSRIPDNAAWTGFGSVATPSGQPTRPSQPLRRAHQAQAHPLRASRHKREWRRSDSNRRPPACKAGALPLSYAPAGEDRQQLHPIRPTATLSRHHTILGGTRFLHSRNLVGQGGLEPPTPRLSSVCSNQLSYWPRMRGVAQSGEGCAVGARHGSRHDQARRQGRSSADNQDFGDQAAHPGQPHPGPTISRHEQGDSCCQTHPKAPRKAPSGHILERR